MMSDPIIDNNFALEQDILRCWNITQDIQEILEDWKNGHMSEEHVQQALDAYVRVYENRFERTFRRYEQQCHNLHQLRNQVRQQSAAATQNLAKLPEKRSRTHGKKVVDQ